MIDPSDSRRLLRAIMAFFLALIVVTIAIAAYRYATPHPEADIEAAQRP